MIQAVVLLALLLALTGCASRSRWYKEGATAQEYKRDRYECNRDVMMMGRMARWVRDRWFDECMESKGWEERPIQ
jgi:hypothetical protein